MNTFHMALEQFKLLLNYYPHISHYEYNTLLARYLLNLYQTCAFEVQAVNLSIY